MLEKRFGNKQQIISRHMDTLLNLEAVTSPQNTRALRKLYNKLETNVRGLDALGVKAESYGTLLATVLVRKLPQELRLIVSRQESGEWTISSLLKILGEELEARKRTVMPREPHPSQFAAPKKGNECPTSIALISGSRSENASLCQFCNQRHGPESCETVLSLAERSILKASGRCYLCLRRGHISRKCRHGTRCHSCGGRHHFALCSNTSQDTSQTVSNTHEDQPQSGQGSRESTMNPTASPFRVTHTNYCHSVTANNTVLLQTAKATLFNLTDPSRHTEVSIIMDSGSQRSYVTRAVSEALGLRMIGKRKMTIMTFGRDKGSTQLCNIDEAGVQKGGNPYQKLILYTTPLICQPVAHSPVKICLERYDYLRNLELADSPTDTREVQPDTLIGLDHYWDFITGEIIQQGDGPVALSTKLGWVLSGPISACV